MRASAAVRVLAALARRFGRVGTGLSLSSAPGSLSAALPATASVAPAATMPLSALTTFASTTIPAATAIPALAIPVLATPALSAPAATAAVQVMSTARSALGAPILAVCPTGPARARALWGAPLRIPSAPFGSPLRIPSAQWRIPSAGGSSTGLVGQWDASGPLLGLSRAVPRGRGIHSGGIHSGGIRSGGIHSGGIHSGGIRSGGGGAHFREVDVSSVGIDVRVLKAGKHLHKWGAACGKTPPDLRPQHTHQLRLRLKSASR